MLHEGSNLKIKLYKEKRELKGSRGNSWGTEAEQKTVVTPKDMFKMVSRSGEPVNSSLAKWGEYDLNASLIQREREIAKQIDSAKNAVSMGDFKDKAETPTVSSETVGKGDLF